MTSVVILDGYIDEPTCLGVPPYISPYPRYIAGAIWSFEPFADIKYYTIDQLRNNQSLLLNFNQCDMLITIAGMAVPGRYLGGYPASPGELTRFLYHIKKPLKILCGPAARYGFGMAGGKRTKHLQPREPIFDGEISGDPEIVITNLLKNQYNLEEIDLSQKRRNASEIKSFAVQGAQIITQHPYYPNQLLAEIETYRGCPRSIIGGCSFCSEPSKGLPDFREQIDIHNEIKALYHHGLQHIRLGSQPCIFSYKSHHATIDPVPKPNPSELQELFVGIRFVAPDLKTIHIDNANPGVLSKYPEECRQIAQIIVDNHTSGDVAALGVESVDPLVIEENNLKATSEDVLQAIRLLNEIGGAQGKNGMPELLPGLNFLFGLKGETMETFQLDYLFLKKILQEQLLLRRINIRQVIPIAGTPMDEIGIRMVQKHHKQFQRFKRRIQTEVEQPLLRRLLPIGTILTDVIAEKHDGNITFGRQMGSYPLLIGIPGRLTIGKGYTVKVIDYGFRSITALSYPTYINQVPRHILESIPFIGKKRASHILLNRPFHTADEFISSFDDKHIAQQIVPYLSFEMDNYNEKI